MTGNLKKANARHEPMVDKRPCGLRSYCDNSRGDCGEQVCKDDEDEIAVWRCRLLVYKKIRLRRQIFPRQRVLYIGGSIEGIKKPLQIIIEQAHCHLAMQSCKG